MTELVAAVKKHALENYNQAGWDFVVETMADGEIAQLISEDKAKTVTAAIKAVGKRCKLLDDLRRDIQAW